MEKAIKVKEDVDMAFVDEVIKRWYSDQAYLIPIMQDIQTKYSYLPRAALLELQEKLNLPLVRVSEVATFYRAMSLKPKGRHQIHVCLGTACHLKGGPRIVDEFKRNLGVEVDQTTKDNEFTLQTVNCVGACALAPVVIIDGNTMGRQEPVKVRQLIAKVRKAAGIEPAPAKAEPSQAEPAKAKGKKPARVAKKAAKVAKKVSVKPKKRKR